MLCLGQEVNYEESRVPSYELPDVLRTESGHQVRSVADWERIRRPELLDVFSETMYGRTSREHIPVRYRVIKENKNALEGKATMRQVELRFEKKWKDAAYTSPFDASECGEKRHSDVHRIQFQRESQYDQRYVDCLQ